MPFRGEYFRLPERLDQIVSTLIYLVPDPDLPFLGIHLTRMIDRSITVGPNAVLAFTREKYERFAVSPQDTADWAMFPGLWKALAKNWRSAAIEMRNSIWRTGYLAECRKYCPSLTLTDLGPYPAGIRAQAMSANFTYAMRHLRPRPRRYRSAKWSSTGCCRPVARRPPTLTVGHLSAKKQWLSTA